MPDTYLGNSTEGARPSHCLQRPQEPAQQHIARQDRRRAQQARNRVLHGQADSIHLQAKTLKRNSLYRVIWGKVSATAEREAGGVQACSGQPRPAGSAQQVAVSCMLPGLCIGTVLHSEGLPACCIHLRCCRPTLRCTAGRRAWSVLSSGCWPVLHCTADRLSPLGADQNCAAQLAGLPGLKHLLGADKY